MTRSRTTAACVVLLLAGCGVGSSTITETPAQWDDYADRTVTVRGNAGNSRLGPIVRFADGGYIALRTDKPWSFDALGRPIEVTGRVVSGRGFRAEKYVLEADKIALVTASPDAAPDSGRPSEPNGDAPADAPAGPAVRLPRPPAVELTP